MRTRFGQDFATGLLFALIGLGALVISADYPMGTAQRPGTGVLPHILSWCLLGSGGILVIKAFMSGDAPVGSWPWRSIIAVTVGTVAFGVLVDGGGLVLSMIVSLTICAMGTPETRWFPEFAVFMLIMLAIGVGMFIWLLGMPIPTWPVKMPDFITAILR